MDIRKYGELHPNAKLQEYEEPVLPWVWEGKYTKEMDDAFKKYHDIFKGYPDCEVDIDVNRYSYEKFMSYINECIQTHTNIRTLAIRKSIKKMIGEKKHGKR